MFQLTKRQERVYLFIENFIHREGFSPTMREIADGLGFKSLNGVKDHLRLMEKKGAVELRPHTARGIFLQGKKESPYRESKGGEEISRIPLFDGFEGVESDQYIALDSDLFGGDNLFIYTMGGSAMVDAAIVEGDMVIIQKELSLRSGEIGLFNLNGSLTLKRYSSKNGQIILSSESCYHEDIIIDEYQYFAIIGKMVGLVRRS